MDCNINFSKIASNIYLLKFSNRYLTTSTLCRLQEYYEFPNESIRMVYFSLEDFLDICYEQYGKVSYFDDWDGFNIPGRVVRKFYNEFFLNKGDLTKKERKMFDIIVKEIFPNHANDDFYLIGCHKDEDIDHEIAHAFYDLSTDYKKTVDKFIKKLPNKDKIEKVLIKIGYGVPQLNDEIQAYLSTSTHKDLVDFGFNKKWIVPKEFKEYFKSFKRDWMKLNS